MNPVASDALGSFIRWLLMLAVPFIVKWGIWSEEEGQRYVAAAIPAIIALIWSLWQKYKKNQLLNTALAMPQTSTLDNVKRQVSSGQSAPATTPSNQTPRIASVVLLLLATSLMGCRVNPGQDPLLVNAEKSHKIAFETVKYFLDVEHDNRDTIEVQLPAVHKFAEGLRAKRPSDGLPVWGGIFEDSWAAIQKYKETRSPADAVTMNNLLAAVSALEEQIRPFLVDMASKGADKRKTKGAVNHGMGTDHPVGDLRVDSWRPGWSENRRRVA